MYGVSPIRPSTTIVAWTPKSADVHSMTGRPSGVPPSVATRDALTTSSSSLLKSRLTASAVRRASCFDCRTSVARLGTWRNTSVRLAEMKCGDEGARRVNSAQATSKTRSNVGVARSEIHRRF
jgi:hypothetical protein